MTDRPGFDALLPPEMARRAEDLGVAKAAASTTKLVALGVLAGAFIALGGVFSTTVAAGGADALPYGVLRLLAGVAFSLGLILVVVGGAELFTGNNLIAMAWASRRIPTRALLRNWFVVYMANFLGALGTAALVLVARQHEFGGGAVGRAALGTARAKIELGFLQAVALGILCNALVCLAVWLALSARSTVDRVVAVVFPITAFVAAGFEHCVANMYFVPYGLFVQEVDPSFAASSGIDLESLSWGTFLLRNLLPVTLGNIVGGTLLVAGMYWIVFLRRAPRPTE